MPLRKRSLKGHFFTFLIFLTTISHSFSQFADDFEDGSLAVYPEWKGMTSQFLHEDGKLRLMSSSGISNAFIYTQNSAIENAEWSFRAEFLFNPSSANYLKVYLTLSDSSLTSNPNGYMIKAGGTSDEISLYRIDEGSETEIIDGVDKRLDSSNPQFEVKVTRDINGNWTLSSRLLSEQTFIYEGQTFDDSYPESQYFGLHPHFTSTRADKFIFDDITVTGQPFTDRIPPQLSRLSIQSQEKLRLEFSEAVDLTLDDNFLVNGGNSNANLLSNTAVELEHAPLKNGYDNTVLISGIADSAGNVMPDSLVNFFFFESKPVKFRDVVINEIMADPSPPAELPEREYLEVFNASNEPVSLENWTLSDQSTSARLDSILIYPGEYLILTPNAGINDFEKFGKVLGVSNWPSLNNTDDIITLKSAEGQLLDRVSYNETWYGSALRSEGGWSLEIIDSSNPCGEERNWKASENPDGGTPGRQNSIAASLPDRTGPKVLQVYPETDTLIIVEFDERLDSLSATSIVVDLAPEIIIESIHLSKPGNRQLFITLGEPLLKSRGYKIEIGLARDCNGNLMNVFTEQLLIPEIAEPQDLVINEILFNPREEGVDFLELYNRSDKVIDLYNLSIGNQDSSFRKLEQHRLLEPFTHALLTSNVEVTLQHYPLGADSAFIMMPLPSFNNQDGAAIVKNGMGITIDSLFYDEEMHSNVVVNPDGVSLERISPDQPTASRSNWFSAAETVGFATPGYLNSQSRELSEHITEVEVLPKVFSPNNDGYDDYLAINYSFDRPGYIANVNIFRLNGSLAFSIAQNELLPPSGTYVWDGRSRFGEAPGVGSYILLFEIFNPDGTKKVFKERIAIAGI